MVGALREDICAFMIVSCLIILRMRNIQTQVVEKIKTRVLYSIIFIHCAIYEVIWKNIVESNRPQMTA